MFGTHLSRMGSVHRLGLVTRAIGILRKYGTDAHVYLPGVGTVSGLTAGNYLDSAGVTAASVDNPVGLSLDALQAMTMGSELVTNGTNLVTTAGWTPTALSGAPASLSVSAGSLVVTNTGTTYGVAAQTVAVTSGKTYLVSARLTKGTAAAANIRVGSTAFGYEYIDQAATSVAVPITCAFKATSGSVFISLLNTNTPDGTGAYNNISVREIPGIHATQATTANKPILRLNSGKYSWQFDGSNDSLSLSAPLFQMSDDHAVIAGFNAAALSKYVFSQGNSGTAAQCGSLRVDGSGFPGAVWIDDAAANTLLSGSASCLGSNIVAAAVKIGNAKRLRVNGVQSGATNNTVLGTTTLNSYSMGSLNGSSGNFQGLISPVITIKGSVTDSDLLTLERWVGQLSGVSI